MMKKRKISMGLTMNNAIASNGGESPTTAFNRSRGGGATPDLMKMPTSNFLF